MQQKSFRLFSAIVLVGLGVWGWRTLFPSPERVIRSRLLHLAKVASFQAKDGTLARAYKVQQFPDFFTPDVVILLNLRGYGEIRLSCREQLEDAEKATLVPGRVDGLKVELQDISVTLGADKQTAVANLAGKVTIEAQSDFIVNEFNFSLKKVDGKWRIYRVESVRTLSRRQSPAPAAQAPIAPGVESTCL